MSWFAGVPGFIVRIGLLLTVWLRTRVYSAPPPVWPALGVAAFTLAVLCFLFGAPEPGVIAAAGAAGTIQPVLAWRRLRIAPQRPAIALARFANENSAYEEIATVHVREVERRLRKNDLLDASVDLRIIGVPVQLNHAERILRYCPLIGVLSGTGLAVGGSVRWEGWALLRHVGSYFRSVAPRGGEARIIDREVVLEAPEQTSLPVDAQVPASSLTAEVFSANHARALEAIVMAQVALWTSDASPSCEPLRSAAEAMAADLPLSMRADLVRDRIRVELKQGLNVEEAVARLEHLAEGPVPHWGIWDYAFTLMLERPDLYSASDRLRVAEKNAKESPNHALAQANVGATLLVLEQRARAVAPLATAAELSSGDEPANFFPSLMANLFRAGGSEEDWWRWQSLYRRVRRRDRPGLLAQLQLTKRNLADPTPPPGFGSL
jgi:hypothetical protein